MNRWDEIQATARDVASNIHSDPDKVTAMADDLIKLVGLMVDAVGKGVAIDGESNISDPDDESAHARYLTGEAIQRYAQEAVAEASSPGCDLERWTRPSPTGYVHPEGTGWTYTDRRPDELKRTAGTVTELRTFGGRTLRTVPDAPESCGAVDAADLDACGLCPDCRRSQMKAVPEQRDEQAEVDRMNAAVRAASPFGPVQRWGTQPEQAPQQAASQPSQDCPFLPGDAVPACDFDPNCPAHGILGKPAATAVRDHVWVTAEEGDPDTLTDWLCNTCRVARCDGSCGDASVGAAPDPDCPTHGDRLARRCHGERCQGCGGFLNDGHAHGPNQGFGGCV
jgi:hypothetical protein